MLRVLFVCTGNICRSPTAEGVFRKLVADAGLSQRIEAASSGTHSYHVGDGADSRSVQAARRRGYDLSAHRARRLGAEDFDDFDYLLAMDADNMRHMRTLAGSRRAAGAARAKLAFLLDFSPAVKLDGVPDPYLGAEGFETVLDIIETAAEGLLEHIRRNDLGR